MELISLLKLAGFTEDDFVNLKNTFDNLEATAERSKRIEEKLDLKNTFVKNTFDNLEATAERSKRIEEKLDLVLSQSGLVNADNTTVPIEETDVILFPAQDQKPFDDMQDNYADTHNNSNIGKS